MSARTHNDCVTALSGFARWMVREGRALNSPLIGLSKLNDARAEQRAELAKSSFLLDIDAAGNVVDFYGLRHTCGSLLAASGAHPKVAQTVMRHSDTNLTLSRYSHVYAGQEAQAVENLPDLAAAPQRQRAKATGTDNAKAGQDAPRCPRNKDQAQDGERAGQERIARKAGQGRFCLGVLLGASRGLDGIRRDESGQAAASADAAKTPVNTRRNAVSRGDSHTASGGI